jgi:beta-glucanase (GH16 family)
MSHSRSVVGFVFVTLAAFLAMSCSEKPVSVVPEGMSLVWSDEFDSPGAPDPKKWDYSTGFNNGWGNGEVQNYTNKRDNSFVKDGCLVLKAINDGGIWTSARLKTQYIADWTYGYFEFRAQLPKGVGTWPAIWMLPTFATYGEWPRSGEIDIMEYVGRDPDKVLTTAHTASFYSGLGTQKTFTSPVAGASTKFHVYGLEWEPDFIQWSIDGKSVYRFHNSHVSTAEWPFDIPYYMILNLAVGGTLGGKDGIDPKLKDATMKIDYVRVYQKK